MSEKKTPIRSCVSCRASIDKGSLIRIVRNSDGVVRIDPTGKMPGRGAYLCGRKECLAVAVKSNKLEKALKCKIPDSLKKDLEDKVVVEDVGTKKGDRDV